MFLLWQPDINPDNITCHIPVKAGFIIKLKGFIDNIHKLNVAFHLFTPITFTSQHIVLSDQNVSNTVPLKAFISNKSIEGLKTAFSLVSSNNQDRYIIIWKWRKEDIKHSKKDHQLHCYFNLTLILVLFLCFNNETSELHVQLCVYLFNWNSLLTCGFEAVIIGFMLHITDRKPSVDFQCLNVLDGSSKKVVHFMFSISLSF